MAYVMLNSKKLLVKLRAKILILLATSWTMFPWELAPNNHPMKSGGAENLIFTIFTPFESKCYVLNDGDCLEKFEPKSDGGVFIGYLEK